VSGILDGQPFGKEFLDGNGHCRDLCECLAKFNRVDKLGKSGFDSHTDTYGMARAHVTCSPALS
jgi:hypothetical protein